MKIRILLPVLLVIVALAALSLSTTVQATPAGQLQYATPTPGPDGRILYTVQDGENCTSIALKSAMSVEQLRALNSTLNQNCDLVVGQQLLLGFGGPAAATVTPGPSPTATIAVPTATVFPGGAIVCVLLFDDLNGDGLRQDGEWGVAGGAVSLTNLDGNYAQTQTTIFAVDPDTLEPIRTCFEEVPAGTYTVSMGIPDGFNDTSELNVDVLISPGDQVQVAFGAQSRSVTVSDPGGGGLSPTVGLVGGLFLLLAGGLGWYAWRVQRPRNPLGRPPVTPPPGQQPPQP